MDDFFNFIKKIYYLCSVQLKQQVNNQKRKEKI